MVHDKLIHRSHNVVTFNSQWSSCMNLSIHENGGWQQVVAKAWFVAINYDKYSGSDAKTKFI